ncbi:GNAT family N-acetyltransferase [Nocardiopsis rhodophaea]|uniref:GNAT family N-acetyltransferase n=1 Tax=Nocardiopsis rhodophaea TaxID=280238 RepID=A0ABN2SN44_9ACTN
MSTPRISVADEADIGEIWTVQRAAYLDEAQAVGDPYIAPLAETREQIGAYLGEDRILLKAVLGGRIVGTARGRGTGAGFLINRLAVVPDARRRGIGRALLAALEEHALRARPDLESFALVTGRGGAADLRLYRALGYTETGRERLANHITTVHLRKPAPGGAPEAPVG